MLRGLIFVVFAAAVLALGGCISANSVASKIVDAPNGGHPAGFPGAMGDIARAFYSARYSVPVGPPPANLAFAIIEPRNYGFSASGKPGKSPKVHVYEWRVTNAPESAFAHEHAESMNDFLQRLRRGLARAPICRPPAGTVMLLPGWGEQKETLLGYALDFANHGYRVILVDLRGQGASSGKYVTFGLIEHKDVSQLITALAERGFISGRLALVGFSEGATVALDTAASDPRVSAVVAVAPFVNLHTAIEGVGHDFMPTLAGLVSEQKLERAIGIAGQRVGLNLAESNPVSRVGQIHVPVLYVAGDHDDIAPAADVKALAARTPDAEFTQLPVASHLGLYLAVAKVAPLALSALGKHMGTNPATACLTAPLDAPPDARYQFTFGATVSGARR